MAGVSSTSLDVTNGGPLYQQLRQQLISRIRRGEFGPGDMLPSENQLCEEYRVSVTTARRALLELVKDGVVRRRIGVGTMVAPRIRQVHLGFVSIDNLGDGWRGISAGMVELIGGIGELAWRRNASFSMSGVDEDGAAAETLRSVTEARSVDGILLRTAEEIRAEHLDLLDASGMPYVVIKRELRGRLLNCVVSDDLQGARLATAHLVEQGHTRIAFVCGKPGLTLTQDRLRGYREALAAAGLPHDPELVRLEPSFDAQAGRRAARALLERPDRPTALFVASDTMAIGAYAGVSGLGLRIPRDVALVGYDDIGTSALLQPPLTTVRTGYHDFGRLAAQLLLDLIEGRLDPPQRIVIKPELIVRTSTGAAPSDVRPARSAGPAPTGELAGKRVTVGGASGLAELLAAPLVAGGAELARAPGGGEAGHLDGAVHVVDLRRELEAGLGPALADADHLARTLTRRGSLVLVALLPAAERTLSAAAAAGVEQAVRTLAASWSGRGLRVGAVLTDAADLAGVAGPCRFLLSDAAAAVSGQVLRTTDAGPA